MEGRVQLALDPNMGPVFATTNEDVTVMGYKTMIQKKKKTPWRESASELDRPNDRRLSAKLVPTFAD
jgi:hypothetical protein